MERDSKRLCVRPLGVNPHLQRYTVKFERLIKNRVEPKMKEGHDDPNLTDITIHGLDLRRSSFFMSEINLFNPERNNFTSFQNVEEIVVVVNVNIRTQPSNASRCNYDYDFLIKNGVYYDGEWFTVAEIRALEHFLLNGSFPKDSPVSQFELDRLTSIFGLSQTYLSYDPVPDDYEIDDGTNWD